jgi:hypothetical protein
MKKKSPAFETIAADDLENNGKSNGWINAHTDHNAVATAVDVCF